MKLQLFTTSILILSVFTQVKSQQIGDLDTSFNGTGKVTTDFNSGNDGGTAMVIQPDNKVVVVGFHVVGTNSSYALSRYNSDGSLDTSFGGTGKIITDFAAGYDFAATVALQPDGKIIAAGNKWTGNHGDNSLVRYNSDGTLDTTFGTGGKVETAIGVSDAGINSIQIQPDGKIVAAGISTSGTFSRDFAITRYNTDGSLDNSFGTAGIVMFDFANSFDFPFALLLQPDGKIVVGGATGQDPVYDFGVLRLDTLGNVDSTFGTNGIVITDFGKPDEWANALALQSDGKIIQCGYSGSPYQVAVARYLTDGTLDTSFATTGKVLTSVSTHDEFNAVALQTDGKIVVAGQSWFGSNRDFGLVRYLTNGIPDTSFSSDGFVTTDLGTNSDKARAVAIQADGKIVAAGATADDFAVARYIVTLSTGLIDFGTMNNSVFIYPNPVADIATLSYTLSQPEQISIELFDMNGRLVKTVVNNEYRAATEHFEQISFDANMAPGNYLLVVSNQTGRISIKVVK